MGILNSLKKKKQKDKKFQFQQQEFTQVHNKYDDDINDAVNLVLAMQQDRNTINIELSFACNNLPNGDMFSLSDPMVVVFMEENGQKKLIGMTEVVNNTLNPIFTQKIIVSFNSKMKQKIKFEIYDVDNLKEKENLEKQELLGQCETDLSQIVYKDVWDGNLKCDNRRYRGGNIKIQGIESDIGQSKIWFTLELHDFLTKNHIYFTISGANVANQYFILYKSRSTKNSMKGCFFDPFRINSNQINNDSQNLKFEFYEYRKDKISRLLGELDISLLGLFNNKNQNIDIYKNNLNVGKLRISDLKKDQNANFFSYVYSDFCLKPILAIDLSVSKKKEDIKTQNNQDFLNIIEKLNIKKPNNCQEKIIEEFFNPIDKIISILEHFDDSQEIPVLGFGAKLPPNHSITSQCFSLSQNIYQPFFNNSKEIIKALQDNVIVNKEFVMNGPTFFSHVVHFARKFSNYLKENDNKYYVVLIIITNNLLQDVEKFKTELKKCSNLPISIVICNSFNFQGHIEGQKNQQNEDEYSLNQKIYQQLSQDLQAENFRDILHWFKCKKIEEDLETMTKSILAKIPKQFVEYMEKEDIKPK